MENNSLFRTIAPTVTTANNDCRKAAI